MRTYANTAKRGNNAGRLIVILYNIRSVYNVGSIFRTCDGAGVKKIYLIGVTPIPLDRFGNFRKDFSKVSLGAEKMVEWEYAKSFLAVYKKLKNERYEILAVEQDENSIPYFKYRSRNKRIALIFGEETKGLPKSILNKADKILEIPMRGVMVRQAHHPKNLMGKPLDVTPSTRLGTSRGKESLNVSVAAGVVVYYLTRESIINLGYYG